VVSIESAIKAGMSAWNGLAEQVALPFGAAIGLEVGELRDPPRANML